MQKTLIGGGLAIIAAFGLLAIPASAADPADPTRIYGPYASDSKDTSTCGNTWANDRMDRVYLVDTRQNPDETYNVTQEFQSGTFTTLSGKSPGACETGADNGQTVPAGLTGKFQGSFDLIVWNGIYDPSATCPEPCYTKDFVRAYFGSGAVYDLPTWNMEYDAKEYGHWKSASADQGGYQGDIFLAAGQTFTAPETLSYAELDNKAVIEVAADEEAVTPAYDQRNPANDRPLDLIGRLSSRLLIGTLNSPFLLAVLDSLQP